MINLIFVALGVALISLTSCEQREDFLPEVKKSEMSLEELKAMPDPSPEKILSSWKESNVGGENSPQRVSSQERYLFCEFARLRDQDFSYEENGVQYRVFYIQILDDLGNLLYKGYFTENIKEKTYKFISFRKKRKDIWTKTIPIFSNFEAGTDINFTFTEITKGLTISEEVESDDGDIDLPPLDYTNGYWESEPFSGFFKINFDGTIQVNPNLNLGKKSEVQIDFDEPVKKFELIIYRSDSEYSGPKMWDPSNLRFTFIGPIDQVIKDLPNLKILEFIVYIPENNDGVTSDGGRYYHFTPEDVLTKTEDGISYYEINVEN